MEAEHMLRPVRPLRVPMIGYVRTRRRTLEAARQAHPLLHEASACTNGTNDLPTKERRSFRRRLLHTRYIRVRRPTPVRIARVRDRSCRKGYARVFGSVRKSAVVRRRALKPSRLSKALE